MLFVCHPKILHKYCLQFLLRVKMARRETENNAYAKFWGDKQRALWYVMVFSGVVNCFGLLICSFLSKLSRRNRHRRTRNFLPGRAVNHLPKKSFKLPKFLRKRREEMRAILQLHRPSWHMKVARYVTVNKHLEKLRPQLY